jgi:hypothetical protein
MKSKDNVITPSVDVLSSIIVVIVILGAKAVVIEVVKEVVIVD